MALVVSLGLLSVTVWHADLSGQAPVPRPFPGATPPAPRPAQPEPAPDPGTPTPPAVPETTRPAVPQPVMPGTTEPTDAELNGAPVYPSAEFLVAFDAGRGQHYYLYGTNATYEDIVAYYRSVLRDGGREIFEEPPVRQFELGRFDDDTMVFPPSVTVKDYAWNGAAGYLFASGATERRFRTIIQIVPAR